MAIPNIVLPDQNYCALRHVVREEEFTAVLDMLAEIALERIDIRNVQTDNERMEKVALFIRACARSVEHFT